MQFQSVVSHTGSGVRLVIAQSAKTIVYVLKKPWKQTKYKL